MIARGGLDQLRESRAVLSPVKFAAVDNYTSDGGAVATNPLGSTVDDNVGTKIDGTDEIAAGSKGVINLDQRC